MQRGNESQRSSNTANTTGTRRRWVGEFAYLRLRDVCVFLAGEQPARGEVQAILDLRH